METPRRQPGLKLAAWVVWLLTFSVICADVVRRPLRHNTTPTYRLAAQQWWQGIDPYRFHNHDGFLYLPQAAILFTPFTWGPFLLGEIAWRLFTFGLFAYAMVRLQEFFLSRRDGQPDRTFLYLSLLAVPSSLASLRNAQFDLPLAALLILGAAEVAGQRWPRAACWMCFAVALKPLAVVPLLLFGALYFRKLLLPLLLGLVAVALLPFLNPHPAFVAHEYMRCAQTLAWASGAHEPRYSDLGALLEHVSIYPPDWLKTATRLLGALVFLALGWVATRRQSIVDAAWTVGALSAVYLMLFNPRTETCSYVFLAPFTASLALWCAWSGRSRWMVYMLVFASLGFACDAIPVVHLLTDRWLKPLLALCFFPIVVERLVEGETREPASAAST